MYYKFSFIYVRKKKGQSLAKASYSEGFALNPSMGLASQETLCFLVCGSCYILQLSLSFFHIFFRSFFPHHLPCFLHQKNHIIPLRLENSLHFLVSKILKSYTLYSIEGGNSSLCYICMHLRYSCMLCTWNFA